MLLSRLPLITAVCLVALIFGALYWQLFPYVNQYLNDPEGFTNFSASKASIKNSSLQTTKKTSNEKKYNIAQFKLFGDALAPVKKEVIQTETLPETTLRLTLTGVLAGKDNIQASALIEGPDRQTRNYRVDEEVPGGAILKQVYADRVVLERSGRLENLIFEEKRPLGIEFQTPKEEAKPVYTQPSYGGLENYSAKPDIQSFNNQQTQQIKDRLSRLRNRLQNSEP